MTNDQAVWFFQQGAEPHLHEIARLLQPHMKITLIVRDPNNDEGDIVLTIDELAEVRKVIDRSIVRSAPH